MKNHRFNQSVVAATAIVCLGLARVAQAAPMDPSTVSGLVGWYDAQQLAGADGTAVPTWADKTGGANAAANDLSQVTGDPSILDGTQTGIAPTLQTVTLNGYACRVVRFAQNIANEYDLLRAPLLVADGDTSRTIIIVSQAGGATRPAGFGSATSDNLNSGAVHWNLMTDSNGSLRFDGVNILTANYSAGLDNTKFQIRTSVMESYTSFDEFIDTLDTEFTDNQVLNNGNPPAALGTVVGDFFLGDLHQLQVGGGGWSFQIDILEALVFDKALSDGERQGIQEYLVNKYVPPLPSIELSGTGRVNENLDSGTLVGALSMANAGAWTAPVTYSFIDGANDNASFQLSGANNGNLLTAAAFDYETKSSYSIDVLATDSALPTANVTNRTLTITVDDVSEPGGRMYAQGEVQVGQTLVGALEALPGTGDTTVTYAASATTYHGAMFDIQNNDELHLKVAPAAGAVGDSYFVDVGATGDVSGSLGSMLIKVTVVNHVSPGTIFLLR